MLYNNIYKKIFMALSLLLLTDQVLKEHIESLPAKRKKAHWRASRHALRLKSKRRTSGAVQSQSSSGGIQAAAGGVGGDGNTAVGAMTGPAAAAGLSRASVSSTRTLRSFDMNSTEDSGMSVVLYGCWNIQCYCYLAVFESAERKGKGASFPRVNLALTLL